MTTFAVVWVILLVVFSITFLASINDLVWLAMKAFTTKHRKLVRVVLIIVGAAVYFNIGWAYGTYAAEHLRQGAQHTTMLQNFLVGPNGIMSINSNIPLSESQLLCMFLWPIFFMLVAIAWTAWLTGGLLMILVGIIGYIFRLIFAGGIAKLLGVG